MGGKDEVERFERLVREARPRLVRRARRVLGDDAEAEDLVQETLSAVWARSATVRAGKLRAYLARAVELNALKRRARRRRHVPLDEVSEIAAPGPQAASADFIDPLELERGLAGLPGAQQAVLRLKYYADMTFREIGETLSISANTASSRCRYALAALRRTLSRPRNERKGDAP